MKAIQDPPIAVPMQDQNGTIAPVWQAWFVAVSALSNTVAGGSIVVTAATPALPNSVNIGAVALPLGSGQITFPAMQNPSSNVNTLDDYEEGTWTPSDGSGAGLTFTVAGAVYTKIGKLVTVSADIAFPATASAALNVVNGLPFTTGSGVSWSSEVGFNNSGITFSVAAATGGTSARFYAVSGLQLQNVQLSTVRVMFTLSYQASA